LYTDISFQLELGTCSNGAVPVQKRSELVQGIVEDMIKSMVENPEDVTAAEGGVSEIVAQGNPLTGPWDCTIITTGYLKPGFDRLAEWRNSTGVCTKVEAISTSDPAVIRDHVISAYDQGAGWILLGGDVSKIPCRTVNLLYDSHMSRNYPGHERGPTDLYFSGLEGDWNANGNTVWGEHSGAGLVAVSFADENNGWATGMFYHHLVRTTDGGRNWEKEDITSIIPTPPPLTEISFVTTLSGDPEGCAVAYQRVFHYSGGTWTQDPSNPFGGENFRGVYLVDENKGWTCGDFSGTGRIRRISGGRVLSPYEIPGVFLKDIYFLDASHGWVVGHKGNYIEAYYTDNGGITWDHALLPFLGGTLESVCFTEHSPSPLGWAVGRRADDTGLLLFSTDGGHSWIEATGTPGADYLYGVSFIDDDEDNKGYAVGMNVNPRKGVLLYTTNGGHTWSDWGQRDIDLSFLTLYDIAPFKGDKSWTVGENGIVMLTEDGGETWEKHCAASPDLVDLYPDVWIGRAPVDDGGQVDAFVDKVLTYEKDPGAGTTDYLKKMLFMGGSCDDQDGMGVIPMDEFQGIQSKDFWGTNIEPYVDLFELYGPKFDPIDPPPSALCRWNADPGDELTRTNTLTQLNQGSHLIIHFEHCDLVQIGTGRETAPSVERWLSWSHIENPSLLYNGFKYPVFWTGGCKPNAFDDWSGGGDDCVLERLVLPPNRTDPSQDGAVAAIGNTRTGYFGEDHLYYQFLESLFSDKLCRIGNAFATTQDMGLPGVRPWTVANTNLLGDPAMPVWTDAPQRFTVMHPPSAPASTFDVKIKDWATGRADLVKGATVCLYKPRDVIINGGGDFFMVGMANFIDPQEGCAIARFHNVYPSSPGGLHVTVTKRNYIPHCGQATVGAGHGGNNWVITSDTTIHYWHYDIDTLRIESGVEVTAIPYNGNDTTGIIWIDAQTIIIDGVLSADGAGYEASEGPGQGTDGSSYYGAGGGAYGGRGGHGGWGLPGDTAQAGGYAYSDSAHPNEMGSGGGDVVDPDGGRGGGIIKLFSSNATVINGRVSSDGGCGTGGGEKAAGGGAGGGIWIETPSLSGSGLVSVRGGSGANGSCADGGGGSGGRIRVTYSNSSFDGRIDVSGGIGPNHAVDGQCGTALVQRADTSVSLLISPVHAGTNPDSKEGFIKGVEFADGWGDSIVLHSSSYILADRKGYSRNEGTGRGHPGTIVTIPKGGGGAGYGGIGGHGRFYVPGGLGDGGIVYGDSMYPDNLGSGGGDWDATSGHRWGGGSGGGRITLKCFDGTILLNGTVSTSGGNGTSKTAWAGGGGSGGSISIYAEHFQGTGTIDAEGGNGAPSSFISHGGGGGGGRISLHRDNHTFSGNVSVAGGLKGGSGATDGAAGTIYTDTLLQGRGPQNDYEINLGQLVFKLFQNSPNPFLNRTTIRYSVPRKVRVSLKVFDVTGRCVETLVNGERKPGYHETELGTKKLGPGVYFAKFEASDYKEVRKLILMR
jgi:hypothetical protein